MPIRVEFYGIARHRAGVPAVELATNDTTLSQVLVEVAARFPAFGQECISSGTLAATLAVNLDGERFITDPTTPIRDGQSLLILSADAGG